jgi:hypothetical protein
MSAMVACDMAAHAPANAVPSRALSVGDATLPPALVNLVDAAYSPSRYVFRRVYSWLRHSSVITPRFTSSSPYSFVEDGRERMFLYITGWVNDGSSTCVQAA